MGPTSNEIHEGAVEHRERERRERRVYEVEVTVEIELEVTDEDAGLEEAYEAVDAIMNTHWNHDELSDWHYTMLEGCVRDITEEVR